MAPSRVTASDVARAAGVSQPTVSRVFNNSTAVDPEKAARVRAVANELGYIPNLVARTLNSGQSFRIGVILAHLKNAFFGASLERLSEALHSAGRHGMHRHEALLHLLSLLPQCGSLVQPLQLSLCGM